MAQLSLGPGCGAEQSGSRDRVTHPEPSGTDSTDHILAIVEENRTPSRARRPRAEPGAAAERDHYLKELYAELREERRRRAIDWAAMMLCPTLDLYHSVLAGRPVRAGNLDGVVLGRALRDRSPTQRLHRRERRDARGGLRSRAAAPPARRRTRVAADLPEGYTTRFSVNGNHDDYRPAHKLAADQPDRPGSRRIVPKRDGPIYPGGRVHLFRRQARNHQDPDGVRARPRRDPGRRRSCIHLDFEMGAHRACDRLREMGATDAELGRWIRVEPRGTPTPGDLAALLALAPTLAIIDAAAGAYAALGLDDNSRENIKTFANLIIDPLTAAGISSITIDHVVKNADNRGRYAIGCRAQGRRRRRPPARSRRSGTFTAAEPDSCVSPSPRTGTATCRGRPPTTSNSSPTRRPARSSGRSFLPSSTAIRPPASGPRC